MLAFELKETERINLSKHLQLYCKSSYGEDQARQAQESLDFLHAMRQALDTIRGNVGLEQAKITYGRWLNCCHLIEQRFPTTKQSMMFTWKDAFRPKTMQKRDCGMPYEKIAVIFNIGAIHSKLGAQQDRKSTEGTKEAIRCFQFAAGAFNYVRDNVPSGTTTGDLSEYSLKMCTSIMLAQAQSCFYEKAVKDGLPRALLAKLANQTAEYYNSAGAYARKMGHDLDSAWAETCVAQENGFRAAAQYQLAMHEKKVCEETLEGHGACIARMKLAIWFCDKAMRMLPHVGSLRASLIAEKEALEKDNRTVYMEIIPPMDSVSAIEKISMVKPHNVEIKDFLEEHQAFPMHRQILESLLPQEVRSATADYRGRIEALLLQIDDEFKARRAESQKMLSDNGLPFSVQSDSGQEDHNQKIPDTLWEKIQACCASGGIEAVKAKIASFGEMQRLAQSQIDRVHQELDKEKRDDQSCREQLGAAWTRLPSDALTTQFKTQIESYQTKLQQAVEANQQILARLDANAAPVKDRLNLTRDVLEAAIPVLKMEEESSVSAQKKAAVRLAMDELESTFTVAENAKGEFHQLCLGSNIDADLLAANHEHKNLAAVVQDSISKFTPDKSNVQNLLNQTNTAEAKVKSTYEEFKNSVPRQQVEQSRATYLADLDRAATAVQSCLADANDGAQFFQRLLDYLRIVNQQVGDFVYARTEEKASEMEMRARKNSQTHMPAGANVPPELPPSISSQSIGQPNNIPPYQPNPHPSNGNSQPPYNHSTNGVPPYHPNPSPTNNGLPAHSPTGSYHNGFPPVPQQQQYNQPPVAPVQHNYQAPPPVHDPTAFMAAPPTHTPGQHFPGQPPFQGQPPPNNGFNASAPPACNGSYSAPPQGSAPPYNPHTGNYGAPPQ